MANHVRRPVLRHARTDQTIEGLGGRPHMFERTSISSGIASAFGPSSIRVCKALGKAVWTLPPLGRSGIVPGYGQRHPPRHC